MQTRLGALQSGAWAAIVVMLMTSLSAAAWHWHDETPSELLQSRAGDPRIVSDGATCFDATKTMENTTCVVLYPHLLQPFSGWMQTMNLIRPADCTEDLARGSTLDPAVFHSESRAQVSIMAHWLSSNNSFRCGDDSIFTGWTDFQADIRLDPRVNVTGYWYLSADMLEVTPLGLGSGSDALPPSTGVLACVTVEMVLKLTRLDGDHVELARGETTKTVVSGHTDDRSPVPLADPCPGSEGTITVESITEFGVDLGRVDASIDANQNYLQWDVAWYHTSPHLLEEFRIRPVQWNLHTGPDNPPRIHLPVQDSLRLLDAYVSLDYDGHPRLVHTLKSPWGFYDVDRGNIRYGLENEQGRRVDLAHLSAPYFDDHFGRLMVVTPWDVEDEALPLGHYTLSIASTNWQHTSDANLTAWIEITDDYISIRMDSGSHLQFGSATRDDQAAPFPSAILLLLLILGLCARRRPR